MDEQPTGGRPAGGRVRAMVTAEHVTHELGGHRSGSGWMVCCPAHEDRTPSLSITERDGKLLFKCFAGCEQQAVVTALRKRGLWPDPETPYRPPRRTGGQRGRNDEPLGPIGAEYIYRDENGAPLFRVTRHVPKNFRQWRPDGRGGWLPGLGDARRVLYHLPEVIEAAVVVVAEGERDVETLRAWGFVATCNPGGAGKWRAEYNEIFRGRTVIIVPDLDEPGRAHAQQVFDGIRLYASSVIILDLEDAKDVTACFESGHSEVELIEVLEQGWKDVQNG